MAETALTYAGFMALAEEHAAEGGSEYMGFWDERTFDYFVANFGPVTEARALSAFAQAKAYAEKKGEH